MKKLLSLVIISVKFLLLVNGFNLENRLPIWKYGPENSYFGYSIASHVIDEHNHNSKWLVFCISYLLIFCFIFSLVFCVTPELVTLTFLIHIFNKVYMVLYWFQWCSCVCQWRQDGSDNRLQSFVLVFSFLSTPRTWITCNNPISIFERFLNLFSTSWAWHISAYSWNSMNATNIKACTAHCKIISYFGVPLNGVKSSKSALQWVFNRNGKSV